MYNARKLIGGNELDEARNLLFEIYCEELKWVPEKDNLSGLRVEFGEHGPMLVDYYDDAALWFGCYCGNKLVGVHRSYHAIEGHFELSNYTSIPPVFRDKFSVEFTRLAIAKTHQRSPVFIILLAEEFNYLRSKGIYFGFTTASFPSPGQLYIKTGMKKLNRPSFKYHHTDPNDVSILYYDFSEHEKLDQLIRLSEKLKLKYSRVSDH